MPVLQINRRGYRVWIIITAIALLSCSIPAAYDAFQLPSSSPLFGKTFVLDAGHGGQDAGCHVGDIRESDLALAFTLRVGALLEQAGCMVVYTRTDQDGLCGPDGRWDKQDDMRRRAEIIQNAQPDAVLSFHMNTFSTPQTGAQIFIQQPVRDGCAELAEAVRDALQQQLMPENTRQVKQGDYYILRKSPGLGILIECGFLNNPQELVLLQDPSWQDRFAVAVCSALSSFFATYQADPSSSARAPSTEPPQTSPIATVSVIRADTIGGI